MDENHEDKMSNYALHIRLHKVEMATIYRIGFWGFVFKYLGSLFGLFKLMGF